MKHVLERGAPRGVALVVGTDAGVRSRGVASDAVFEIGSITKTFTATLLAAMVRDGLVALDDPVARHLPVAPPVKGRAITLEDLATHRSGLPRLPAGTARAGRSRPSATTRTRARRRAHAPGDRRDEPKRAPGGKSPTPTTATGCSATRSRSARGDDLRRARARRASPRRSGCATPRSTRPADPGPRRVRPPGARWDLAQLAGAGGLRSTAARPARLPRHPHARDGPLAAARADAARRGRRRRLGQGRRSGSAWLDPARLGTSSMHDGGTGGFRSFAAVVPATGRRSSCSAARRARSVDRLGIEALQARDAETTDRPARARARRPRAAARTGSPGRCRSRARAGARAGPRPRCPRRPCAGRGCGRAGRASGSAGPTRASARRRR